MSVSLTHYAFCNIFGLVHFVIKTFNSLNLICLILHRIISYAYVGGLCNFMPRMMRLCCNIIYCGYIMPAIKP